MQNGIVVSSIIVYQNSNDYCLYLCCKKYYANNAKPKQQTRRDETLIIKLPL